MLQTILHNGTCCLQIRVPRNLVLSFGRIIRLNLQTFEKASAQRMAYRLAGDRLDRFAAARLSVEELGDELAPTVPTIPAPQPAVLRNETAAPPALT